jgi:serine/threonine-protein kinase
MFDLDELKAKLPDSVEIAAQIYDGGQRKVYRATSEREGVVVKLMPDESRERAEREVSIGSTFDHPNLARILDEEVNEIELAGHDYVWFREEFIEGETLDKRTDRYDLCQAIALATDLTAAVTYLWEEHQVVHRDIKPLNIIRRPDGSFVLLDVGIGRHQGDTSITSGALGPGTRGHIAPEQITPNKGRTLDGRTDLFLIGIVIFDVLCGQLPFRSNQPDYETKLLAGDWPRPQGLPAQLSELLERFLSRHPHQRPSLSQAAEMIDRAKDDLKCS